MSIGNLILGVNSFTFSYLIHYDSLLQNATAILLQNVTGVYYEMRQVFYYKMWQFYYKTDSYYKMRRFYYKMDSYYKMRRLLQIATVQTDISFYH